MTEIFPDEGLDMVLAVVTGNQAAPANLYMGLFTSQTASTVPARDAVLATQTGVTEVTGTGYVRVQVTPANWGAPATNGNGRKRTSAQKTFPTVGAGGWGIITGFFIADSQTSGVALFYANFDDTTANTLNAGDVQKVTPAMQFDG
jgi:hypothetical protein